MNLAMQRYEAWRRQPDLDGTLANELLAMEGDAEKITDSFGCDLAFGTAGLRGVLGAGTNRMNIYTVARATQGLATWLAGSGLVTFFAAFWKTGAQKRRDKCPGASPYSKLILSSCG